MEWEFHPEILEEYLRKDLPEQTDGLRIKTVLWHPREWGFICAESFVKNGYWDQNRIRRGRVYKSALLFWKKYLSDKTVRFMQVTSIGAAGQL